MKTVKWEQLDTNQRQGSLARNQVVKDPRLTQVVHEIMDDVRDNKDQALLKYTKEFDQVKLDSLQVSDEEYESVNKLNSKSKDAILHAIDNIKTYHETNYPTGFEYQKNGIHLGKMYRPIEKVGLYVPGGTAPLVSTVMMLAVPASLAGCETKVLVTPPNKDGSINKAILFAAKECGIDAIYKVGGAQAIAALTYGTETIPKVHKVFGPGNKYVTEAKIIASGIDDGVAIDMPAGPSEVMVIGDKGANASFIASDLLAQAEHDEAAHVVFVTPCSNLAKQVEHEICQQVEHLSRKETITQSLKNSVVVITDSIDSAFNVANLYAPEHLILHIKNARNYLDKVKSAGSVFLGQFSPESAGDYASGPNHVLPTYGYANMYSGLDVLHFMKSISYQELSHSALKNIGDTIMNLADLEGLDAHKNAVKIRLS